MDGPKRTWRRTWSCFSISCGGELGPKMRVNGIVLAGLLAIFGGFVQAQLGLSQAMRPQLSQQSARPLPASSTETPGLDIGPQNPFFGAVPRGNPTTEELPLSLTDAIERGL